MAFRDRTKKFVLVLIIFATVGCIIWKYPQAPKGDWSPAWLSSQMRQRQRLLRENCSKKPPNPSFIEEADFTRFIVIEKLKFVFCFIPKVSCTTWKNVLYRAENDGKGIDTYAHDKKIFKWLKDYTPEKRKEILETYYKAMFVREPIERLASAYKDQKKQGWFKQKFHPGVSHDEVKRTDTSFSEFMRKDLLRNDKTSLKTNQHWRAYELICPCEVNYDFIGHFENLPAEAPQLLKIIGVDKFVTFPDYRPSKSQPYILEYYSQLTKDELLKVGKIFELDFKLYGYDFPGPVEGLLRNKTITEEALRQKY